MQFGPHSQQQISRWLAQVLSVPPPGEIVNIALVHASLDQSPRAIRSWQAETRPSREAFATLVEEIDTEASADAVQLGGMQRYFMRAYTKGGEVGSTCVRYNLGPAVAEARMGGVDSEPSTLQGLLAQNQRHLEAMMRLFTASFGPVVDSMQKRLGAQDDVIDRFTERHMANIALQEELGSKKLERDLVLSEQQSRQELEAFREATKAEQSTLTLKQVLPLGTLLVRRLGIFGAEGSDTDAAAKQHALEAFLASLSPEQKAQIAGVLTPVQQATLIQLFAAQTKEEESPKQSAATPTSSASAPPPAPRTAEPPPPTAPAAEVPAPTEQPPARKAGGRARPQR